MSIFAFVRKSVNSESPARVGVGAIGRLHEPKQRGVVGNIAWLIVGGILLYGLFGAILAAHGESLCEAAQHFTSSNADEMRQRAAILQACQLNPNAPRRDDKKRD